MAKKKPTPDVVSKFLAELSKDPAKLGAFILNPQKFFVDAGTAKKYWSLIWRAVAVDIMKHLVGKCVFHVH